LWSVQPTASKAAEHDGSDSLKCKFLTLDPKMLFSEWVTCCLVCGVRVVHARGTGDFGSVVPNTGGFPSLSFCKILSSVIIESRQSRRRSFGPSSLNQTPDTASYPGLPPALSCNHDVEMPALDWGWGHSKISNNTRLKSNRFILNRKQAFGASHLRKERRSESL